jgi:DegV family protein with EDD domain
MLLVVDSSSDLPKEIIEKHNIHVVPLTVSIDGDDYQDGVDITSTEFYARLENSINAPKTSQVVPEQFIEAFTKILNEDEEIICITIGSAASGTCQSAFLAKEEVDSERISIIDSNGLCMGTGYLAIIAANMIDQGKTRDEIVEVLTPLTQNKIEHLFCVDTLEYLKKGGRIRASKALVAEILNIKPVLNVKDALTETIGKVRGRKKIIPYYLAHIENTMDFEASPFLSVAHSVDEPFALEFIQAFREKFNWEKPIYISELGATIGTHAGPGVLATFYIKK